MSPKPDIKTAKRHRTPAITTRVSESLAAISGKLSDKDRRLEIASQNPLPTVVVAFSGGLDSTVLLHAVTRLKDKKFGRITAVHVHHGLSKNAGAWAEFCQDTAKKFGAEFVLRKVKVVSSGEGIEAAARKERYRVLEEVLKEQGASALLTAHHLDDQIETFLIQWMRGAGPEGLSAMPALKADSGVVIARPFLAFTRKELEEYAAKKHLQWVEDESNEDTAYLRNALRNIVIPEMEKARPGFKMAAQRSIELVAEASQILRETAAEDLKEVSEHETGFILLDRFFKLSAARQTRLLRLWISLHGLKPLQRNRLLEILRQIKETDKQSVLLFTSNDKEVRRYGARLMITAKEKQETIPELVIQWQGEESIDLPGFDGRLVFKKNPKGFNETYLKAMPLTVKTRSGSAKLKIHPFRPSKKIKVLYKEAKIPDFERAHLPLIWRNGKLIFAARLGEEIREKLDDDGSEKYSMEFVKNPELSLL